MSECELCVDRDFLKKPISYLAVKLYYVLLLVLVCLFLLNFSGLIDSNESALVRAICGFGAVVSCVFAGLLLKPILYRYKNITLWWFKDTKGTLHIHKDDPCHGYKLYYFGDKEPRYLKEQWTGNGKKAALSGFETNCWDLNETYAGNATISNSLGVVFHLSVGKAFAFFEAVSEPYRDMTWERILEYFSRFETVDNAADALDTKLEEALEMRDHLGLTLAKMQVHMDLNPQTAGRSRHAAAFKQMIAEGFESLPKGQFLVPEEGPEVWIQRALDLRDESTDPEDGQPTDGVSRARMTAAEFNAADPVSKLQEIFRP